MNDKLNNLIFFISTIFIVISDIIAVSAIYTFITILFSICTLKTASNNKIKVKYIILYALIYIIQMVYIITINNLEYKNIIDYKVTNHLICILLLFITFVIEKKYRIKNYDLFYLPYISDLGMITYSDLKKIYNKGKDIKKTLYKKTRILKKDKFKELIKYINKTNSFKYINKKTLTDKYFENVQKSLVDDNIYLIISNTGTTASQAISIFTNKEFNHISISFDSKLKTIISYNGGANINMPGLNMEKIEYFYQNYNSSILIYSLNVGKESKKCMRDIIKKIDEEGNAYNILGMAVNKSFKPNIMYCSQFIYKLLEITNNVYFQKSAGGIKPTDFVELDYNRKLKFKEEIKLQDLDKKHLQLKR